MHMQIYLFLQHDEILVPLDLEVVLARLDLRLQLLHFFLLLVE